MRNPYFNCIELGTKCSYFLIERKFPFLEKLSAICIALYCLIVPIFSDLAESPLCLRL